MKFLPVVAFLLVPASLFGQHLTHLTCKPDTADGVTVSGFNFYRSEIKGGPYTKLNATPVTKCLFDDTTIKVGKRYYYVVRAVSPDASLPESLNSNEAAADVKPGSPTGLKGNTK